MIAVNLTVLGTDYSLYTHVHHSYGLNDAFDRSVAHLLTVQQPEQLDSDADSLLQDSVQHKPLDQDDTAITAVDTAEGRRRNLLQSVGALPRDRGNAVVAGRDSQLQEKSSSMVHPRQKLHDDQLLLREEVAKTEISSRSVLQQEDDRMQVEHPCLHEGYFKEYKWVAHGAHVAPLPQVQLLGRYRPPSPACFV